ncbi:MAG: hypothetical protein ABI068_07745, partial [Ktedonobacterales bacterium]
MAHDLSAASERRTAEVSQPLGALIERARRVLQHEQRTGHADVAVKPGGLEAFVAHWSQEVRDARAQSDTPAQQDGASGRPAEDAISRLLTGYHALDPMQRTAKVRAALALLDALLQTNQNGHSGPSEPHMRHESSPAGGASRRVGAPAERPVTHDRVSSAHPASQPQQPAKRPQEARKPRPAEADWPLAAPLPVAPTLRPQETTKERISRRASVVPHPEDIYLLDQPVTAVAGVGQTQALRLTRLGIETVRDLLEYYPREHLDYSTLQKIGQLPFDEVSTVLGLIWE